MDNLVGEEVLAIFTFYGEAKLKVKGILETNEDYWWINEGSVTYAFDTIEAVDENEIVASLDNCVVEVYNKITTLPDDVEDDSFEKGLETHE